LYDQTNKIFLLDFGFTKRYDYNGKHIPEKKINSLIGSPNFVSLNIHNGTEPGRRDDIESCIYVIIYMLYGTLDWIGKSMEEMIVFKTLLTNNSSLPVFFKNILLYVRNMQFSEIPNYEYLLHLLVDIFNQNGYKMDGQFEWT
jgi:serine/threonine protein kinase